MEFMATRIIVVVIAIITAYVFYSYVFKPFVLEPMCLINSNGCARMGYYNYNNSALIHMRGTGIWIWFNGDRAFIYGQPVGQICDHPDKYTSAYTINTRTGMKEGYKCVMTLEKVIDFYKEKGGKMKYMVTRVKNLDTFNAYDVLNLFNQKNIIDLSTSGA